MTLYDDLKAAGVPLDSHGSDLYAKVTEDSRALVEAFEFRDQVTVFRNAQDGHPWYDIPFAFSPFWDEVHVRAGAVIPDVGKRAKIAPDAAPCCYLAAHGVVGLHALDCREHRPETCPTCQEQPR